MKRPPWLQELRDLLAIVSYDGRQDAMMRWEQLWLVELQARQFVNPEMAQHARIDMLEHKATHVRRDLGVELGNLMVDVATGPSRAHHWGVEPMIEVRGEVMAIRREPKSDD